jgi:hypothetical protein
MTNFEKIWNRIKAHEGETFTQIRGGEFTYEVSGNIVIPNRTNRMFPRSNFEEAFSLVPLKNTVPLQQLQGPSYLYAIMMDERIRHSDW